MNGKQSAEYLIRKEEIVKELRAGNLKLLMIVEERAKKVGDCWDQLDKAKEIVKDLEKKLGIAIQALSLIAAEQRSDGTYNRDREACGKLARETLEMMR